MVNIYEVYWLQKLVSIELKTLERESRDNVCLQTSWFSKSIFSFEESFVYEEKWRSVIFSRGSKVQVLILDLSLL